MLYRKHGEPIPYALLRETDAFGIRELDLVAPPSRFWTAQRSGPEEIQIGVDEQRVEQLPTPCSRRVSVAACSARRFAPPRMEFVATSPARVALPEPICRPAFSNQ